MKAPIASPGRSVLFDWQSGRVLGPLLCEPADDNERYSRDGRWRVRWQQMVDEIVLEDCATGDQRVLKDAPQFTEGAAFSRDAQRLYLQGLDGTLRVYRMPCGELLEKTPSVPFSMLRGDVAIEDGSDLIQIDKDEYGVFSRWSYWRARPKVLATLPLDAELLGVAPSTNGERILTWDNAGRVRVWDAATRKPIATLEEAPWSLPFGELNEDLQRVWSARLSPDGTRAALIDEEEEFGLWDARTGRRLDNGAFAGERVRKLAFMPKSGRLLVWHAGGVSMLDTVGGTERLDLSKTTSDAKVLWTPDGRRLATWDSGTDAFGRWRVRDGARLPGPSHLPADHRPIALVEEGQGLIVNRGGLSMLDVAAKTASKPSELTSHYGEVDAVLGPQGRNILTWKVHEDLGPALEMLRVGDGAYLWPQGPTDDADRSRSNIYEFGGGFSPDGELALTRENEWEGTGVTEYTFKLRRSASGEVTARAMRIPADPESVADDPGYGFSHDGTMFLAHLGRTVYLWDVNTGDPLIKPTNFDGSVLSAWFTADDKDIAVWTTDGRVQFFSLTPSREVPPESLELMAQVMTGTRIDRSGGLEPLRAEDWWPLKRKLDEVLAKH